MYPEITVGNNAKIIFFVILDLIYSRENAYVGSRNFMFYLGTWKKIIKQKWL